MFEFCEKVLAEVPGSDRFDDIEALRSAYLQRHEKPDLITFGASSRQPRRSWAQLAHYGGTPRKWASLLVRLERHIKAVNVLELGTSLGLTSLYLSSEKDVKLTTIEGDPLLASEAERNFYKFARTNITLHEGNINDILKDVLNRISPIDLAYIDANHRFTPTLLYFNLLLDHVHENTVLVFDDVHWSAEMSKAWKEIIAHPRVSISADLYRMGIVFFRPMTRKYNYLLSV